MRLARLERQGRIVFARLDADVAVPLAVEGSRPGRDALRDLLEDGVDLAAAAAVADPFPVSEGRFLSPLRAPQKVLAIGLNYRDHARESGAALPTSPMCFAKTPNALVGPDDVVTWSRSSSAEVDYEAELAVVIGRRASKVSVVDARSYVLGYTNCNDVSARDAQFADGQWTRGKSFDTFCPLGPWIETDVPDPENLWIRLRLNGTLMQDGTTSDLVFGIDELVSRLSQVMTLEPGDVIPTGTPVGVGFARTPPVFLQDGDVMEVEIEGLGVLRNTCSIIE